MKIANLPTEKHLDNIVSGLTYMTPKQLAAVAHLLAPIPDAFDDIAIAAKLPRSNQGRKRQEQLIVKKVRKSIDEEALEKLSVRPAWRFALHACCAALPAWTCVQARAASLAHMHLNSCT